MPIDYAYEAERLEWIQERDDALVDFHRDCAAEDPPEACPGWCGYKDCFGACTRWERFPECQLTQDIN